MSTGPEPGKIPHVQTKIELKLKDFSIKTTVSVPQGKTTVRYMLPLLRGMADAIVQATAQNSAAEGKPVSCRKGCSACCHHLVPLSEAEAYALAALIESMPEERRGRVKERLESLKGKLRELGLFDSITHLDKPGPELIQMALTYLTARLPCPFLEENACSIHADRPIACREFMVSSDPAHCWYPAGGRVASVHVPSPMDVAVAAASTTAGAHPRRIALPLILDYVVAHPEPEPDKTGPEVVQAVLRHLTGVNRPVKTIAVPGGAV